jgi:3-oxoacyl-(acyl-carrier-protein) reductase
MRFENRFCVVTGSARGIGKAIATRLFGEGATVVLCDLNKHDVDRAREEIVEAAAPDGKERIAGATCNVADPEAVKEFFGWVKERFGRLDVLVNNAGITRDNLFSRMTVEQWTSVIDVNLTGTFLCCKYAFPLIRKSSHGRIVNLSSVAAGGNIGQANYAASKAGVIGLTKTLAIEFARYDVTVNAVAPGFIDTEMTRAVPEKARQHWIEKIPAGRAGTADDIAAAVTFLASDESSYITGEVMEVHGGMNAPESIATTVSRI